MLVRLADDTWVEVDFVSDAETIAGGTPRQVKASLNQLQKLIARIGEPVAQGLRELTKVGKIDQAEIEVGFGIEGEGNIYLAKLKGSSNLKVKFVIKPESGDGK